MAVYVDPLCGHLPAKEAQAKRVGARNDNQWCHLGADSTSELISFARRIGMRDTWIQHMGTDREHYDLTPGRRATAVLLGALEVTQREFVEKVIWAKHTLRAAPPAPPTAQPEGSEKP